MNQFHTYFGSSLTKSYLLGSLCWGVDIFKNSMYSSGFWLQYVNSLISSLQFKIWLSAYYINKSTLEKTFFSIVETRHAKWLNLHTEITKNVRLLSITLLKYFSFIIAFSWFSIIGSTCFFAILIFLDISSTSIPSKERVQKALSLKQILLRSILYQKLWSFIIQYILL
jgi:hypothetical protein